MQERLPFPGEANGQPQSPIASGRDAPRRKQTRRDRPDNAACRDAGKIGAKKLLSVEEAAVLLDTSRATLYRAIKRGELALPLFTVGRRLRIPRAAIDRVLEGEWPLQDANVQSPRTDSAT